jgi:dsDNA-specific endonuclease/ATPase MutS2
LQNEEESIVIEIKDVIDLHTFRPEDISELLDDYIRACVEKSYSSVRIIHGKGKGFLKARVEKILKRHPLVTSFQAASPEAGGWGATIAIIG